MLFYGGLQYRWLCKIFFKWQKNYCIFQNNLSYKKYIQDFLQCNLIDIFHTFLVLCLRCQWEGRWGIEAVAHCSPSTETKTVLLLLEIVILTFFPSLSSWANYSLFDLCNIYVRLFQYDPFTGYFSIHKICFDVDCVML